MRGGGKMIARDGMHVEFLTPLEIAKMVMDKDNKDDITFTLDTESEIEVKGEATGWYGIAKISIFDEINDLIAIGYYGGDETMVYNFNDVDLQTEDEVAEEVAKFIVRYLRMMIDDRFYGGSKLCVDMEDRG